MYNKNVIKVIVIVIVIPIVIVTLLRALTEDVHGGLAGVVELPAVELQADDGEHEDGEEQEQANLKQRDHGLHDGLEHDLQAWEGERNTEDHVVRCTSWYLKVVLSIT